MHTIDDCVGHHCVVRCGLIYISSVLIKRKIAPPCKEYVMMVTNDDGVAVIQFDKGDVKEIESIKNGNFLLRMNDVTNS